MTMGLIVDKDGLPKNIHILSPLGAGLDAKAVQAVENWKFQPAEKDGQPVAVQIAIEVDFHLY
jgi:TonB family protein